MTRKILNTKTCPPLLLCDFYKTVHSEQYNPNITKLVSYYTPRMTRINGVNAVVMFGLQAFCREYLHDYFDRNFFDIPKDVAVAEYTRYLNNTLGKGAFHTEKIEALHDLGYLPLEIKALPEGTIVPIHVPMIEISNTHPKFAWVTNAIESLMSCELWHKMVSANVGYIYRLLVNRYYDKTVDDNVPRNRALGDFSMRGQESLGSAVPSSAAFCLSFLNTATVPAVVWFENNYYCDSDSEDVIFGSISTEHSVMCSNFAIDGDEITAVKRFLVETYPKHSFSMVSDSYDYWNMVDNIIPACRDEIMAHEGCLLVRGDSGDPVEIVTQTVFHLWNTFGGTVNSKGYKVLDPHIKAIYGDSITLNRADEIYNILEKNGFAANNVALGVGSFSMQCMETPMFLNNLPELKDKRDELGSLEYLPITTLNPFTRDTYGVAVKATYGEIDGEPLMIFKNPKTDTGNFKKSQRGMCCVYTDDDGVIQYVDGLNSDDVKKIEDNPGFYNRYNMFETVFKDSEMVTEYSLKDIRNRLHGGKF